MRGMVGKDRHKGKVIDKGRRPKTKTKNKNKVRNMFGVRVKV